MMPDSLIVAIAKEVVAVLDAATLSIEFEPTRGYRPHFTREELEDLHVTVVPRSQTIEAASRAATENDIEIDVAVQKAVDPDDNDAIDPLMLLIEEIGDLFRLQPLGEPTIALWTKTATEPLYSQQHMKELRQFSGLVTLTFRMHR